MIVDVLAALFFGSLVGHGVHMALHKRWSGPLYRAHLDHHKNRYPPSRLISDKYLGAKWYNSGVLLFTPPLLTVMGVALWLGASWVFCVVLLAFAVANDAAHDAFHVHHPRLEKNSYYRHLRALHFIHHHWQHKNFGIVSHLWDAIFGTKML